MAGAITFGSLEAGEVHGCGLTSLGGPLCWGRNGFGAVGDGTNTDRLTPTVVAGAHVFVSLTAGEDQTCGLTSAGEAYCWGDNTYGQLGDGTTTSSPTPVRVTDP